ncbi:Transposon TX1 uncharacterized protein [Nymphaea thermarum]|nr:Transposon TX1 uncharacterized protein [Nymphaea thermarum]
MKRISFLGRGLLVLVRGAHLFQYRFRISLAPVIRRTSALRRLRSFRPCSPHRGRQPLLSVPCLPFPFAALRAGPSRESTSGCPDQITLADQSDLGDARSSALSLSAARSSAGDRPREVAVVARSCSIAACAVLASGVLAPPGSLSPSVSCALLFTLATGPPVPALAPVAEWDEEILSLQASENISAVQSSRLLCLQGLTQEWRIRESIHWQQRSRLGWLAHGNQNSRFFHLAASQRRRQTLLQSMNIGGRVFLGDDILPALSAHFRDFYSKPLRFRATLPDFHLSPLSVSCAISLERPFLHQEIKNAVWALSSGKAPGIDGFPVEFFRTFWEVCSADVFAFCDEFTSNSVFLKEFNQATCVLVPKRLNPTDVTHFRLISILGTPYKIIAKLLSLRLAPVMPSIINPFQVAFVKGRRLQDAFAIRLKRRGPPAAR